MLYQKSAEHKRFVKFVGDTIVLLSYQVKVVVRACYGTYVVAHVFKYLAPNFVSGRPV